MTTTKNTVAVTGNTYPVKDKIKAMGGQWNAGRKCWMVPVEKASSAHALVAGAGPKKAYSGAPSSRSFGARGGAWNGCSMGCRDGNPNPRCQSCCFDEFDN